MKTLFAAAAVALSAGAFAAGPQPVAYDMNNGHGTASSGSFNYWDRGYSGIGCTTCDNAFLAGGRGDLTDGVVTTENWFAVENAEGTGPYVGWRQAVLPEPSVLFRFAAPVSVGTVSIHADDSNGAGGVNLPSTVRLEWQGGATQFDVVDPDPGFGPSWLVFANLGIASTAFVRVGFGYGNEWVFVDEVAFETAPVPEPATAALWALGLAGLAAAARRRR